MGIGSSEGFGLLMLMAGIFISYVQIPEEEQEGTIIINQPIFAQLGIPSDKVNETNMATQIAPTISENTTNTPMQEVNDTLIGGSTPTTSNTLETNEVNNKSGEAEPIGGIK